MECNRIKAQHSRNKLAEAVPSIDCHFSVPVKAEAWGKIYNFGYHLSDSERQRGNSWLPRWGEGLGVCKWAESGGMKALWRWTAAMTAGQWECTYCH